MWGADRYLLGFAVSPRERSGCVRPPASKSGWNPHFGDFLSSRGAGGLIRTAITAKDRLGAVASLRMHTYEQATEHARDVVALLADGRR